MDQELGYNTNQTDETYVVVKMDEQRPLNDTSCRHEQLIADPEDKLGKAVMHMCANPKCGIGFYIK
jgi:hypothetical protein